MLGRCVATRLGFANVIAVTLLTVGCGDDSSPAGGGTASGGASATDCAALPADCEGKLASVGLEAVSEGAVRVEELTLALATACQSLSVALGASPDEHPSASTLDDAEAWCAIASQRLVAADATISLWLPLCTYELEPLAACEAACSGVDSCEARPSERCSLQVGSCAGVCTGLCASATGPAECEGQCLGACTGTCGGQPIEGGECAAGCSGSCLGGCDIDANCSQLCVGNCDVEFEDARCRSRPLGASAPCDVCGACSEACAWRSNLTARCAPAPVVVVLASNDAALAEVLSAGLSDAFATRTEIELVVAPELLGLSTLFLRSFEHPATKACVNAAQPSLTALQDDLERLSQSADALLTASMP